MLISKRVHRLNKALSSHEFGGEKRVQARSFDDESAVTSGAMVFVE